jgi:uncharacterized protein
LHIPGDGLRKSGGKTLVYLRVRRKFMTTTLRNFIAFALSTLLLTNIYGQTTKKAGQDTTLQQQLSTYRQLFWDSLPAPIGWTNDFEGLYTYEEELVLDSIVSIFKSETGFEFAIVTIDTIVIRKEKFDELTLRIANQWGVGEKGKDNGILIAISRGHRKIRINNGFGIEKLITDTETKEITDNYFIPYFMTGDYYNGTLTGLNELIKLLKTKHK